MVQDLISVLGGGERVGEAALRQTLELGSASSPDGQRPADTTWAGPGRGNGGNGRALPRVRPPRHLNALLLHVSAAAAYLERAATQYATNGVCVSGAVR